MRRALDEHLLAELSLIRVALQGIEKALTIACALPEPPPIPEHPAGEASVGVYAQEIESLEGSEADEIRSRLRAAGLNDHAIEEQIVSFLLSGAPEE